MKKGVSIFFVFALLFSISACSNGTSGVSSVVGVESITSPKSKDENKGNVEYDEVEDVIETKLKEIGAFGNPSNIEIISTSGNEEKTALVHFDFGEKKMMADCTKLSSDTDWFLVSLSKLDVTGQIDLFYYVHPDYGPETIYDYETETVISDGLTSSFDKDSTVSSSTEKSESEDWMNSVYDSIRNSQCAKDSYSVGALVEESAEEGALSFELKYVDNPTHNGTGIVTLHAGKKSITIDYQKSSFGNIAPPMIKGSIKAVLMASGATAKEADECTDKIIDTYTGDGYSEIAGFGDYRGVLAKTELGESFYLWYGEEYLPAEYDVTKYEEAVKEELPPALNVGNRYRIQGTVVDSFIEEIPATIGSIMAEVLQVIDREGEYFFVVIQREKLPIVCEIGDTYEFYGYTSNYTKGTATLWAENAGLL